jgi:hypothetical protein
VGGFRKTSASMIKVVIATILLYPHIGLIWKLLSVLGFIFFSLLLFGFLVYLLKPKTSRFPDVKLYPIRLTTNPKNETNFQIKSGLLSQSFPSLFESKGWSQDFSQSNSRLQMMLHSMIKELVTDQLSVNSFTKQILEHFLSTPKTLGESSSDSMDLFDIRLQKILHASIELFHSAKGQNLYETLWINGLECLCEHIKVYRKIRKEVEEEQNLNAQEDTNPRHLDDYNEFSAETDDENMKWSHNLDKLHELIILRLRARNKLHQAIGKDFEQEREYLRSLANQYLQIFNQSKVPTSSSKMIQILVREWIVCKGVWPFLHHISQPNVVNQYILEKMNRKLIVQRAVKFFCQKLEADHTQFPPAFLISNYVPKKFGIHEKLRYLDVIGKYSRKARSIIDINAVRHEIIRELKKEREEIEELKPTHIEYDSRKRYMKMMDEVLRKLDKRLKILAVGTHSFSEGIMRGTSGKDSTKEPIIEISLDTVLDKYFRSSGEKGDMHSTSLFYFLDFLEKKNDWGKSLNLLRFWAATEKFKRLVYRIGNGILTEPSTFYNEQKVEEFSFASHTRLQKEILKIYESFELEKNELNFSPQIIDAYKRYIKPLSDPNSEFLADDYLCVFKTQRKLHQELEKVFEEFQHSNSYFKWSSEILKSKVIQETPLLSQTDVFIISDDDWIDVFEESALMNSLEISLFDACGRVTGLQAETETNIITANEPIPYLKGIITLDDIVIDRELSKFEIDMDQTSPQKDNEDDDDVHPPGELVTNSSKLAQIKQSMDRVLHQIECLNLLHRSVNRSKSEYDPLYIMQCHIIGEAKDMLGEEIGDLSKQKAKLESQEQKEPLIPGQCFISIQELDDVEEDKLGKKITYYLITVEQRHLMTGWTVKRRYSDFDTLHHKLRDEFDIVNDFELPSKTLGLGILSRSKAEMKAGRLKALEKYLQVILPNPEISR